MTWLLVQTGLGAPSWNMAFDEALLEAASRLGSPILRLYGWSEPAATFGYSQHYAHIAAWTPLRPLVRRPTGGGLVPHDADWTYSIIVPPRQEWYELKAEQSYRSAHDWVSASFDSLQISTELASCCAKDLPGQCFIGAEKFDVLAGGRKIAGAAQKRNKLGLLIQGSIQPRSAWKRSDWETAFTRTGEKRLGIDWTLWTPDSELIERAQTLDREKYARDEYNQRR